MKNERELSGSYTFNIKCDGCDEWTNPQYVVEIAGDKLCERCEEIVAEQMWNDHYEQQASWDDCDSLTSAGFGTEEDYGYYEDLL